jgi:H+-transporting ATPase
MRSYALYRIASTIHFLLFFFISILAFDFTLPSRLILLIAVLNDAATLVISVDNARINKRPDKWRLGQLITLSFILGFLLCCISYAHFIVGKYYFELDPGVLETVMYLQISSSPHFVIFSTRLIDPFWKNMPSALFMIAIIGTQIIALFMSVYGVDVLKATAMYVQFSLIYLAAGHGVLPSYPSLSSPLCCLIS